MFQQGIAGITFECNRDKMDEIDVIDKHNTIAITSDGLNRRLHYVSIAKRLYSDDCIGTVLAVCDSACEADE
jgi:hypothetical protein